MSDQIPVVTASYRIGQQVTVDAQPRPLEGFVVGRRYNRAGLTTHLLVDTGLKRNRKQNQIPIINSIPLERILPHGQQ